MRRITKVATIAATALTALIATGTAASASVNVTDGVGFVGKGDVQDALGLANDAAMQTLFKSQLNGAAIKFTADANKVVVDYEMSCYGSDATMHRIISQPGTVAIEATPNVNGAGKLTNGWNLTGTTTEFTNVGNRVLTDTECPAGSFPFMNIGLPTQPNSVSVSGGLKVNGIDLPNTPVEVAPIA